MTRIVIKIRLELTIEGLLRSIHLFLFMITISYLCLILCIVIFLIN